MAKKKKETEWIELGADIALGIINPYALIGKKVAEKAFSKDLNLSSHFDNEQSPYYDDKPTSQIVELAAKSDATACYVLAKRYSEGTDGLKKNVKMARSYYDIALSSINQLNINAISDKVSLAEWLIENDEIEKALNVADNFHDDFFPSAFVYELLFDKTGEEKYREEAIEKIKSVLSSTKFSDEDRIFAFNRLAELSSDSKQKRQFLIGALKENTLEAKERFNKVNDYVINCFNLAYKEMLEKASALSSQGDSSGDMTDMLFSSIDYNERQFVYFAKDQKGLAGCYDENIPWVFTTDKYPKEIHFPTIGHPQPNSLYYAHPTRKGLYLPLESADEELFMDKVKDFQRLVQGLGATEIIFRSVKGHSDFESSDKALDVELNGGYNGVEGSIGYGNKRNHSEKNAQKHEQQRVQRFNPTKQPYIPDDVVWLAVDPEWQRLVKMRIEGNMLHHRLRISSKKTMSVSDSRMDSVKAAFKTFVANGNVAFTSQMEKTFSREEEKEWEISVTFKSLREFGVGDTNRQEAVSSVEEKAIESKEMKITSNEQKYLNSLKKFLVDDAEITAQERKMLDKICQKHGISEERAAELEKSLQKPQLSDDEQVYLDMYHEYTAKGEVTERERRILNEFADAMGIENERIKEIENLC